MESETRIDPVRRRLPVRLTAALVVASAGLVLVGVPGSLLDPTHRLLGRSLVVVGAVLFMVGGVGATRTAAVAVDRRFSRRGLNAPASVLRVLITAAGYVMVSLTALSMLVPLQQLLVGGALTGVVVGIAAQQTLGNVFAGLVILVVRPFRVGDVVEVRSGALNGPFTGQVGALGLTYVSLSTAEGTLLLPNAGVLAAGVTVDLSRSGDVPARTDHLVNNRH